MHLKQKLDLTQFLLAVQNCSGQVYYETPDGDCLVLTSTLSQFIFGSLAATPELLQTGTIRCSHPDDYQLLKSYFVE